MATLDVLRYLTYFFGIIYVVRGLQISIERPEITYYNRKYIQFINISAARTRRGGEYMMSGLVTTKHAWGNNISVDIVFYEFLSNEYRRSFVELHYKLCDMLAHEKWFGQTVYRGGLQGFSCPYPAGTYKFQNMTVSPTNYPESFPYTKALINVTYVLTDRSECLGMGFAHITVIHSLKKNQLRNNQTKPNRKEQSKEKQPGL